MKYYPPLFGVVFLWPSATPLKQVAHWAREGRAVHEKGRFSGRECVFDVRPFCWTV